MMAGVFLFTVCILPSFPPHLQLLKASSLPTTLTGDPVWEPLTSDGGRDYLLLINTSNILGSMANPVSVDLLGNNQ